MDWMIRKYSPVGFGDYKMSISTHLNITEVFDYVRKNQWVSNGGSLLTYNLYVDVIHIPSDRIFHITSLKQAEEKLKQFMVFE